jgi:urea transporter
MIEYTSSTCIEAVFRGVAQVYFMPNTASGVIMLVGMAVCSPISAGFALFGSVMATLTALGLGASP